jgi:hypothetical protein
MLHEDLLPIDYIDDATSNMKPAVIPSAAL